MKPAFIRLVLETIQKFDLISPIGMSNAHHSISARVPHRRYSKLWRSPKPGTLEW